MPKWAVKNVRARKGLMHQLHAMLRSMDEVGFEKFCIRYRIFLGCIITKEGTRGSAVG
jgi:hypothetical protein